MELVPSLSIHKGKKILSIDSNERTSIFLFTLEGTFFGEYKIEKGKNVIPLSQGSYLLIAGSQTQKVDIE